MGKCDIKIKLKENTFDNNVKSIFCFHQSYIDYMTLFDLHYLTGKEQVKTKKLSNSKWSQNLFSNNLLIVML